MPERWLSADEIAAHLGVNPDTIYKWITGKECPRTRWASSGSSWPVRSMNGSGLEKRERMVSVGNSDSLSQGAIVRVRTRNWLVQQVDRSRGGTTVSLACADDDGLLKGR
jgi:hypothetical protein